MCGQGGKPSEGGGGTLVGPGNGRRTTLRGLGCAYAEDNPTPCTSLNLIQHNTSNNIYVGQDYTEGRRPMANTQGNIEIFSCLTLFLLFLLSLQIFRTFHSLCIIATS
jgi:hypothetical protein